MRGRSIALFVVFGFGLATAQASFEMCLVTDSGTDSVHRIDPISNAYLGSFGGGFLNDPRGVAVDQTLGRAYILDSSSRVSVWNYSTGQFVSSFNATVSGATFLNANSDGTINVAGSTFVRRFSKSGSLLATYNRAGSSAIQQGILLNDGAFYMSTRVVGGSGTLERFNYATGALLGTSVWISERMLPLPYASPVSPIATALNAYVFGSASVNIELNLISGGTNVATAVANSTLVDTVVGMTHGHGGLTYILGRDRVTPTRGGILRFDRDTLIAGTSLAGTTAIVTPTGMATVVAPEPGTMIVIGAGIATLIRRRRGTA